MAADDVSGFDGEMTIQSVCALRVVADDNSVITRNWVTVKQGSQIDVENRDYHHLSQNETILNRSRGKHLDFAQMWTPGHNIPVGI